MHKKTIAIINHKGGVGKTTSTLNIGAGLSRLSYKTLLIDLDPQANLTQSAGIKEDQYSIYNSLKGESPLKHYKINDNLFIVPSSLDLSGAEIELSSETGREYILKELIDSIKDDYQFILIDCPPSLGLLTLNALTSANELYIPLQAEYLALQGLSKLLEVVDKIKKRLNKSLKLGGVFVTQYDNRKVLNRNILEAVQNHFHEDLFETRIRNNVSLAEAPSVCKHIFDYSPNSNGAEDYASLCNEIIQRL